MPEPTDYARAVLDLYQMVAFLVGAPIPVTEPSVNGSSEALAEWRRYGVK